MTPRQRVLKRIDGAARAIERALIPDTITADVKSPMVTFPPMHKADWDEAKKSLRYLVRKAKEGK